MSQATTTPRYWRARVPELPLQEFPDPYGRDTSPVRVVSTANPNILEAVFPPGFEAGEHWHPYDTIYIFTAGELTIGDEGVYRPGDIRWVKGGTSYGPEEAGPQGCNFLVISIGGPIGLNWSDEVPPPPGDGPTPSP